MVNPNRVDVRLSRFLEAVPRRTIFFCCRREKNREGAKQERPLDYVLMVDSFSEEQRLQPLVHRDVSPENIVLDAITGAAKLIDFSFVAKTGSDTQQVVGKQAYISPEQFRGQIAPRNDVYSLGATLYFALTGKEPEAIAQQNPKTIKSAISADLNLLVMRCTGFRW